MPQGSVTLSEILVASSWYQLILFLWLDFMPFLAPANSFFSYQTWLYGNVFVTLIFLCGRGLFGSVGGVVRHDLGSFLYILLELFYIEAWHAILPFAISIHLLSPERKILQTGCCLTLGFKFIEYENECMTWVLSLKSSAERQLVCRSPRSVYLILYIVYAIRNCWINVCIIEWEGK